MNTFDAVVYLAAIVAIVMGFNTGLLRSLATIFGYVAAMPVTLAVAPQVSLMTGKLPVAQTQNLLVFFGIFLAIGIVLSALLRLAVSGIVGSDVSLPDRLAGALLGAVRIGLLAVLMVLIFDRIIPPNRQPAFLVDSRLRPILSMAGQAGVKSLPPDVVQYIDRLKRERGI